MQRNQVQGALYQLEEYLVLGLLTCKLETNYLLSTSSTLPHLVSSLILPPTQGMLILQTLLRLDSSKTLWIFYEDGAKAKENSLPHVIVEWPCRRT
jgi:hypothetical protein